MLLPLLFQVAFFREGSNSAEAKDLQSISRCGTSIDATRIQAQEARFEKSRIFPQTYSGQSPTIRVHYHVVYEEETLEKGYVPPDQIFAQHDVLNTSYALSPMGLNFGISSISYYPNASWFNSVQPDTETQADMKKTLRRGDKSELNVYTVGFTNSGLLGYSTFPWDYEDAPWDDGVVLLYSSLPNGTVENYDLGITLVHEVGHWVGLYHTFQNGCDAPGDYVRDTPAEADAAFGCPVDSDTCEGHGRDPVHNFMDYSDDSCLTDFTKGQANRTAGQLLTYRSIISGYCD